MNSIWFVLLFAVLTNANINNVPSIARIYSNLAEIIQPFDKLPIEFTDEDWNNIRSDSITLIGDNINITLQTITEKKKIFNGSQIYIRSPISQDKTTFKLIKAILIDETNSIVKIQDDSIVNQQSLYFTVPQDQIFYLEQPTKPKYYVNFKYTTTTSDSQVFISYLRSNIYWQTQYQLNLNNNNENDLIVMANIRNDGKYPIVINQAELIGGDFNVQPQEQSDGRFRKTQFRSESFVSSQSSGMPISEATVEQGQELVGLYVFPINKSFTINGKTNYLIPMYRPRIAVVRYGLISKQFSSISNNGKAQRSYRLISDRYLSRGSCIIRENDRIVGETALPNLAAKDKREFSIGEDADIIYKENVTLISLTNFNETRSTIKNIDTPVLFITRTKFIYNINLQIKNFKNIPVNVVYEQKGFHSYQNMKLVKSDQHQFIQVGSTIKSNMTLKANTNEFYTYTIELIS